MTLLWLAITAKKLNVALSTDILYYHLVTAERSRIDRTHQTKLSSGV